VNSSELVIPGRPKSQAFRRPASYMLCDIDHIIRDIIPPDTPESLVARRSRGVEMSGSASVGDDANVVDSAIDGVGAVADEAGLGGGVDGSVVLDDEVFGDGVAGPTVDGEESISGGPESATGLDFAECERC